MNRHFVDHTVKRVVAVVMMFSLLDSGGGRGQVGRAIEVVEELQPKADKRNKEIEELAR